MPPSAQLSSFVNRTIPVSALLSIAPCLTLTNATVRYTWTLTSLDVPTKFIDPNVQSALRRNLTTVILPAYQLAPGNYRISLQISVFGPSGLLPNATGTGVVDFFVSAVPPVAVLTRGGSDWLVPTTAAFSLNGPFPARVSSPRCTALTRATRPCPRNCDLQGRPRSTPRRRSPTS